MKPPFRSSDELCQFRASARVPGVVERPFSPSIKGCNLGGFGWKPAFIKSAHNLGASFENSSISPDRHRKFKRSSFAHRAKPSSRSGRRKLSSKALLRPTGAGIFPLGSTVPVSHRRGRRHLDTVWMTAGLERDWLSVRAANEAFPFS